MTVIAEGSCEYEKRTFILKEEEKYGFSHQGDKVRNRIYFADDVSTIDCKD